MTGKLFFKPSQDGILWEVNEAHLPHFDNIELSGRGCSLQIGYGADECGNLVLTPRIIFPTFRLIPNTTEATYQHDILPPNMPRIFVDGQVTVQKLDSVFYNGILRINTGGGGLLIEHTFFPAAKSKAAFDLINITNTTEHLVCAKVILGQSPVYARGTKGVYITEFWTEGETQATLAPGEKLQVCYIVGGYRANEPKPACDWRQELQARQQRIAELTGTLLLQTGNDELDMLFRLCKLHAAETIFDTAAGSLHSPAGTEYYCGIWTNDQVEYANPLFACMGDDLAIQSAVNCYRLYIPFMGPTYHPIPTSIICEGQDIWEGAGDRGDAAMYLYGASRFLLTIADADIAHELLPGVLWCAEYCRRKTGPEGVVCSDSDELEGRFPAGKANLSTNCLCYAGLLSTAALLEALGEQLTAAKQLRQRAAALAVDIERYFGAVVGGYKTYRYYEGCTRLRSWICWPLCVGLRQRAADTVAALFSPKLYDGEGLVCEEGDTTFWDRSTLYALRGAFRSGQGGTVSTAFLHYCRKRLCGERAPYPVEACPEGGMRHLSGECALFLRVITEGILGLEPLSFNSFALTVQLPPELPTLRLDYLHMAGSVFSVEAKDGQCSVWEAGRLISCFGQGETTVVTKGVSAK